MRSVMGSLRRFPKYLAHAMRKCGRGIVRQRGIVVFYDDVIVGEQTADLMVEDRVIVDPSGPAR